MERTRHPSKGLTIQQLKTYSEVVNRAELAARLGFQYSGARNLYRALGYPEGELHFEDFYSRYKRQDIAKAIINRPVNATWQGPLLLVESTIAKDTPFEKEWKKLDRKIGLKSRLARVDKLTRIGRYGVLLLGLNDANKNEDFAKPVSKNSSLKLKYVKPYSEKTAKIDKFVSSPQNERYGQPLLYTIEIKDLSTNMSQTVQVHYSRVIHITDDTLESEVYGTPCLEAVWNRLMDIEKIAGGDAEMFWRGARPGYQGLVDKDFTMTQAQMDKLKNEVDEFEHDLRRLFVNEGVTLKGLEQQIEDPSSHIQIQLQLVSAETGIPIRVLTGSERGELASTQDTTEWLSYVQSRREDHAEPRILRPTVDRLIELGILPKPTDDYTVDWKDLFSPSEKAKVEIGKGRANSIREYTYSPIAQGIIPPKAFMMYCLGLTEEQITLIEQMQKEEMGEELNDIIKETIRQAGEPKTALRVASLATQMQKSSTNWKKVYEDKGAHWMDDLQPTQFAQEFAEELVEEGKTSILEVGCGNGRDSILFSMAGLSVTGIDLVAEAVKIAKENAKKIKATVDFQEGNVEKLTFNDGSFDAVYSLSVLHSTDMKKSIPEIYRILKSKGLALIYIYSDTQYINGKRDEITTVDEYIELLKNTKFNIVNFYTLQDEEYDEAGEKHSIIVVKVKKG